MIQIDDKLISDEVFLEEFVCNLSACKGACCVEGDSGAPLEDAELEILEEEFENIKPYLRPEGIRAIEEQGTSIKDPDGEWVTPLVKGAECAYVTFDEKGTAKCGIEQAWQAGATRFRKPVSCHLYPIRVTQLQDFEALNYHHWPICSPACKLGKELNVKVYRFLKEAIIRKYGAEFYDKLEQASTYFRK